MFDRKEPSRVFPRSWLAPRYIAAALVFLVAVISGLRLGRPIGLKHAAAVVDTRYPRRTETREVVLLYIGSNACAYSRDKAVGAAVRSALDSLRQWTRRSGAGFTSIGVAVDRRPDHGLEHLTKTAAFTEMSVGGAWSNQALLALPATMRDSTPSATPQVLVMLRMWNTSSRGQHVPSELIGEVLVTRLVGRSAISDWASKLPGNIETMLDGVSGVP